VPYGGSREPASDLIEFIDGPPELAQRQRGERLVGLRHLDRHGSTGVPRRR
jgi:hypothetical protein